MYEWVCIHAMHPDEIIFIYEKFYQYERNIEKKNVWDLKNMIRCENFASMCWSVKYTMLNVVIRSEDKDTYSSISTADYVNPQTKQFKT